MNDNRDDNRDHARTILVVVMFLGTIALVLGAGTLWMFREMLLASEGKDSIDPAVVGIFGTVCTLAGGAIGGLSGLLASTRSSSTPPTEPVPVTVENTGQAEAVPVKPMPAAPDDDAIDQPEDPAR